jgi:hypothetical protein
MMRSGSRPTEEDKPLGVICGQRVRKAPRLYRWDTCIDPTERGCHERCRGRRDAGYAGSSMGNPTARTVHRGCVRRRHRTSAGWAHPADARLSARVMTPLPTLGGEANNPLALINRDEVVGTTQDADGSDRSYLWSNGVIRRIGPHAGFLATRRGRGDWFAPGDFDRMYAFAQTSRRWRTSTRSTPTSTTRAGTTSSRPTTSSV